MTNKEFELGIIIGAKDKTGTGIDSAGGRIDKLGAKMRKTGKSMTAGLTLPIIGIGVAATQATSQFETGMTNVSTLVDENVEDMDKMSKKVLSLGADIAVPLDEFTAGLYNVRSAGIAASDSMGVLEGSAKLSMSGLGSVPEAVDAATSSINAFQLKGEQTNQVYDVLFTAVKHGKTNLSQLGQGFGSVAGKMSDAGIEFDEYIASVSAMTTVGLPAAQAHTQMRAAIDGLTKSSEPLSKIFKKLGTKDFLSLIKESGGVVPAFNKMKEAVGGSEAKMRALIGSSEGSAAVMSLTGATAKAFTETLGDMRDGIDESEKAFQKQNKTSAASWQKTKNALTAAAISLGTVLAPVLTKVANKVQELAAWFDGLSDETKKTVVQIGAIVAVVGPSILLLGKLAGAIKLISSAMMANPVGLLVAGLVAIKELTGDSWKTLFSDAVDFWRSKFGKFFEYIGATMAAIKATFDFIVGHESKTLKKLVSKPGSRSISEIAAEARAETDAARSPGFTKILREIEAVGARRDERANKLVISIGGEGAKRAKVTKVSGPSTMEVNTGLTTGG